MPQNGVSKVSSTSMVRRGGEGVGDGEVGVGGDSDDDDDGGAAAGQRRRQRGCTVTGEERGGKHRDGEERGAGIPGGVGVGEEGGAEETTTARPAAAAAEKMCSLTASFELSGAFGLRKFWRGLGAEYIWAVFLQAAGYVNRL